VFYDIVDRHFKTGRATWVDDVQMAKILQRGKDLKPCRCGMTGNNLIMQDTTGQFIPLHEVKADYTVVVFWSSTCGHCKSMIPKLKKFYEDYKATGVEVYGVNIEDESEAYKKYIKKMDLDYINVQDTTHATYFRYYYNVYMTPVIYLLDKDKKIVGKQLAVDSVAKLIDQMRNEYDEQKDYDIYYVPSGKDKH
jgi:thiol-disulfide isomerase/thioredoxin